MILSGKNNLIPFNKRTEEEQREYARQGGKKSGEVRRQRKAMKEQMEMLLSLTCKDKKATEFIQNLGVERWNR